MGILTAAELEVLATSLRVAGLAMGLAAAPAAICAYALARWRFPGRSVLLTATHLPLALPPVLVGYLLLLAFGRSSPLGASLSEAGVRLAFTGEGAALASAVMIFPLLTRFFRSAIEASDPAFLDAAAVLGATKLQRLMFIAAPLAAPGALAGLATCFAAALGEFGAVITFAANTPGETRTLPLAIYAALQQPGGEEMAMRLSLLSLLLAGVGLGIGEWLNHWAAQRRAGL